MKKIALFLFVSTLLVLLGSCMDKKDKTPCSYALILHGGAGNISPELIPPEHREVYENALEEALNAGLAILEKQGSAIDAVERVINTLEDNPLFNAGKGAVFTNKGTNELDASIMWGKDMNAGAVAGVTCIKNPISAARKVMTHSEHVFLSGKGAEKFAEEQGLTIVEPEYFFTQRKYDALMKVLKNEQPEEGPLSLKKMGTVGCVALDTEGNICAGTSTGGMTNKKYGRIGDSPVIGAGTFASNKTCGVSATGHGEFFIRYSVCHEISSLMKYKGWTVEKAADQVINQQLKNAGGGGGVVCLDNNGRYAMAFNTPGMFRAYGNSKGQKEILLFK